MQHYTNSPLLFLIISIRVVGMIFLFAPYAAALEAKDALGTRGHQ